MLQLFAIVVAALIASSTTITSAYGQDVNETQEQKPAEEKQGGEYSGFEEAERQTEGIPNQEANPTPQAPISDLNVQQENQTTTAETTTTAVEPTSLPGVAMLAGIGAVVAVAIVAAAWYFRRNRR
jgi:cobalamin biosynthesis Mg chelatase CobN